MKALSALLAVLMVAALVAPAEARRGRGGNDDQCTDAPRSEWKAMPVVADKARAMGYDVQKTEISGTCYEVYGTKGGVLYELYFNPATAELVKTERD